MNLCNGRDALEDGLALENFQACGTCGGGDRVPRVRMAVIERARTVSSNECLVDPARASGGAHWKNTASEALRQAHQIGSYSSNFAGEHPAAAPKPGEDLIGDEKHFIFGAQPPNALKKFNGMNNHAASALQQRLDNHRRNFSPFCSQQTLKLR